MNLHQLPHLHWPRPQAKLTLGEAENIHWSEVPRLIGWGKTLFFGGFTLSVIAFTLDPPFALLLSVSIANKILSLF